MKIHVKIQNKTYEVKIGDIHSRPIQVDVDGETLEVWPEESSTPSEDYQPAADISSHQSVNKISIDKPTPHLQEKLKEVKAPIPGVIIAISVKEGEKVVYGQELCILEAMKMKNAIRSGREGRIMKIYISEGDSVQHSQVLMEYDE